MYKLNYDINGNILGFYTKEIHGENIPSPTKGISNEVWQYLLDNQNKKIKLDSLTKEEVTIEDFEDKPIAVMPQESSLEEKNRADIDYLLMLNGEV